MPTAGGPGGGEGGPGTQNFRPRRPAGSLVRRNRFRFGGVFHGRDDFVSGHGFVYRHPEVGGVVCPRLSGGAWSCAGWGLVVGCGFWLFGEGVVWCWLRVVWGVLVWGWCWWSSGEAGGDH